MSKRQLIILFGALIILIALFSGLPSVWNTTLYIIIGVLIIAVAYTTRPSQSSNKKPVSAPYVDVHGSASPAPAFKVPTTTATEKMEKPSSTSVTEDTLQVSSSEVVTPPVER